MKFRNQETGAYRFPSGTISPTWGTFVSDNDDHGWEAAAKVSNYSFNKGRVSKISPYVRGSVSFHGHQNQCLGMHSKVEHMTNVDKVVDFILITTKRKLSPSYCLIPLN